MLLVAQIPGADDAIQSATREGWVAVLLVVIVLATFSTFGIVIHRIMKESREREKEQNVRIAELETFVRTALFQALQDNSAVLTKILAACEAICDAASEMASATANCKQAQSFIRKEA